MTSTIKEKGNYNLSEVSLVRLWQVEIYSATIYHG